MSINEEQILTEGETHCEMLYRYKNISKDLPQVKADCEDKTSAYRQHLGALEPSINRLRELLFFYDKTLAFLSNYYSQLVQDTARGKEIPEDKMTFMMKSLDLLLRLDYLKTWQAALNNDFSCYKRAVQHVRKDYSVEDDKDLWFFLVNPSNINKGIKEEFEKKMPGYELLVAQLMNWCATQFDPASSNFVPLRTLMFSIFLVDSQLSVPDKAMKVKRTVKLHKVGKLFKDTSIIPVSPNTSELKFDAAVFLRKCPNFQQLSVKKGCTIL